MEAFYVEWLLVLTTGALDHPHDSLGLPAVPEDIEAIAEFLVRYLGLSAGALRPRKTGVRIAFVGAVATSWIDRSRIGHPIAGVPAAVLLPGIIFVPFYYLG